MWIVRLDLRRPKAIAVLAILTLILGVLSIIEAPTDVFPTIDIPAGQTIVSAPPAGLTEGEAVSPRSDPKSPNPHSS